MPTWPGILPIGFVLMLRDKPSSEQSRQMKLITKVSISIFHHLILSIATYAEKLILRLTKLSHSKRSTSCPMTDNTEPGRFQNPQTHKDFVAIISGPLLVNIDVPDTQRSWLTNLAYPYSTPPSCNNVGSSPVCMRKASPTVQ